MKRPSFWCVAIAMVALSHASQAQILIGQTAGYTGAVGAGVKETSEDAKLGIDAINAKGGVNGQKIELISLDDKFEPSVLEKFSRSNPDFAPIAPKIFKSNTQAVIMVASGQAVVDGTKAFRAAGSAAQIVTLSNNASSGFIKSLGNHARGVIVTQVFPYERSIAYHLVQEAQEMAKAKGAGDISPAMLEGFAAAKVLVEGLRRAGPKPTREKIQTALEGIRKFDLGGLEVSYSPEDHTGLDFADLSIIGTDGKFRR